MFVMRYSTTKHPLKQTIDTVAVTLLGKTPNGSQGQQNTDYSETTSVYSDGNEVSKHCQIWTNR